MLSSVCILCAIYAVFILCNVRYADNILSDKCVVLSAVCILCAIYAVFILCYVYAVDNILSDECVL